MAIKYEGKVKNSDQYVFSYYGLAGWTEYTPKFFWSDTWTGWVDCSGYILTDPELNTLIIFRELYFPKERRQHMARITVNYDFVTFPKQQKLLLPQKLKLESETKKGQHYGADATFKDYHQFKGSEPIVKELVEP